MNQENNSIASENSQRILNSLEKAVKDALEKKRRLGQYAVIWDGDKPVELKPVRATFN